MAEGPAPLAWARNIVCRYYMHGACRQGESCPYSHDLKHGRPSSICKYYQKGNCSFGHRCRYDHQRPATVIDQNPRREQSKDSSKHSPKPHLLPDKKSEHTSGELQNKDNHERNLKARASSPDRISNLVTLKKGHNSCESNSQRSKRQPKDWAKAKEFVPGQRWNGSGPVSYSHAAQSGTEQTEGAVVIKHTDQELCPYAAHGECRFGDDCQYLHGEVCEMCGKAVLNPGDETQNAQHRNECIKVIEDDMERSFAIAQSKDKACGICMETVLDKQPFSEQKFGILSSCTHVYCLSCIRTWRQAKQFENKVVKACPECRVKSDFITPSQYWVEDKEEKEKLIERYKSVLSQKPCKYFDEGRGECPFNAYCFYRHAYPDGRIASPKPRKRRQRRNKDGELGLIDYLLLADFFEERDERRAMLDSFDDLYFQLSLMDYFNDMDESDSDDPDLLYL